MPKLKQNHFAQFTPLHVIELLYFAMHAMADTLDNDATIIDHIEAKHSHSQQKLGSSKCSTTKADLNGYFLVGFFIGDIGNILSLLIVLLSGSGSKH